MRVSLLIREGSKERTQPYEGTVIAQKHSGINETITVRRIFQGVGVEKVIMLHAPKVSHIRVLRRGKSRRAKLYYLRDRIGKATKLKQRFDRPMDESRQEKIKIEKITDFQVSNIDSTESPTNVPDVEWKSFSTGSEERSKTKNTVSKNKRKE